MHNIVFTKPEKFEFLNISHQRGARKGLCTWVSSTSLICNFMPIILVRETQHPAPGKCLPASVWPIWSDITCLTSV